MADRTVGMGEYYNKSPYGLVRTICRAANYEDTNDTFIVYVTVDDGGEASDPLLMPEQAFKNIFLA